MRILLKHKKYPQFRNYEIISNGVKMEIKTNEFYNEHVVKFEDIGFEEQITRYKPSFVSVGLFMSVVLNIIFLMIFILDSIDTGKLNTGILMAVSMGIIIGISAWGRSLFRFEKLKFLKGEVNLSFWYFKKYQVEVDEFIESLKQAKKEYFRNKYFVIDENEDFSLIIQRFYWLKTMEYITETEFQEKVSQLNERRVIRGF